MNYMNEIRINNAINLLKNTTLSVTKISEACGFESVSYFSKSLKAKLAAPPQNTVNSVAKNKFQILNEFKLFINGLLEKAEIKFSADFKFNP